MNPLVKICGITNLADALVCCHEGADALGFIFYRESPRNIEPHRAAMIIAHLPKCVTPVGVFVNAPRETIDRLVTDTGIRTLQLSGDETPEDCAGYPVPVWKAFRIRDPQAVESVGRYPIAAALLDGADGGNYGGTGTAPDFEIARRMKDYHPLILAGGLNPQNVVAAVRTVRPYAIDVNSGVELTHRKKNHVAIRRLFELLRNAQNHTSEDASC